MVFGSGIHGENLFPFDGWVILSGLLIFLPRIARILGTPTPTIAHRRLRFAISLLHRDRNGIARGHLGKLHINQLIKKLGWDYQ
jgi:hypothetical protein